MSKFQSFKQAIVIRVDLGMGKGKMAAQAAHASLEAYKKAIARSRAAVEAWERSGCKKVVLKAAGESHLMSLMAKAKALHIPCALIQDRGLTQVAKGEITALALGPWREEEIDEVTGELKLM
jgi:PTH2 family peptidyl-tRNA hydrolase